MALTSVSPVDGRYEGKTKCLQGYFSEMALMKYRIYTEINYLIKLLETPMLKERVKISVDTAKLRSIIEITEEDAAIIDFQAEKTGIQLHVREHCSRHRHELEHIADGEGDVCSTLVHLRLDLLQRFRLAVSRACGLLCLAALGVGAAAVVAVLRDSVFNRHKHFLSVLVLRPM